MQKIETFMRTRVVTVELDDTLRVVKEIFDHTRFHHVLVVEHERLKGVVSDRDLLRALSPYIGTAAETARDTATLNKKVHQIMSRNLVTLQPDATLADAVDAFLKHHISCIPIVDALNYIQGIVSWRDLLPLLKERE
jgi:acetoin utilization protein AcuB